MLCHPLVVSVEDSGGAEECSFELLSYTFMRYPLASCSDVCIALIASVVFQPSQGHALVGWRPHSRSVADGSQNSPSCGLLQIH